MNSDFVLSQIILCLTMFIEKQKENLHQIVHVGCGMWSESHTSRALDARATADRRTQQGCHSFVMMNG